MAENLGRDFNFFQTVTATAGSFPVGANVDPDVQITIRGAHRIMFVCVSGTNIEYSFNGNTVHGRISQDQIFNFDIRAEDKIWFRGSGEVDVHAWHVGF
jgi:hypothetical protein